MKTIGNLIKKIRKKEKQSGRKFDDHFGIAGSYWNDKKQWIKELNEFLDCISNPYSHAMLQNSFLKKKIYIYISVDLRGGMG